MSKLSSSYLYKSDVFKMLDSGQCSENYRFDRLCTLCASMFDDDVVWKPGVYRSHHDINALSQSAEAACHICSLILEQIPSAAARQLQNDLDEAMVAPSDQIGINIAGSPLYGQATPTLKVAVRSDSLPQDSRKLIGDGFFVIGQLSIARAKDDYTNEARSTAIYNCTDRTVSQITNWLGQCIVSHEKCFDLQTVAATRDILPKRLLDLRLVAPKGLVRLTNSQSMPLDTTYATLSHCWGGGCETTLTISELENFEAGFLVSSIPKTFRDAIFVTRELSIDYLWIDALCIIQDSVDDSDWRQEASIMGDIYANSIITLAATTSSNSQDGLLHQRNPLSVWPCRLEATWKCFVPGKIIVSNPTWARESDMSPLGGRAWAFQEWLLSKRLIHFSKDQVRWECYCLAASEVYPDGLNGEDLQDQGTPTKGIMVSLREDPTSTRNLWCRVAQEYSEKALTKATDKLAAFSGISRMLHKMLNLPEDNYLAGLWRKDLLHELLWERYGNAGQPHSSDLYIAPTWSWASLNGAFWKTDNESDIKASHWHIKILDCKISPVDDPFGSVRSGSLVLQCFPCSVSLIPSVVPSHSDWLSELHHWTVSEINDMPVTYDCRVSLDHLPLATLTSSSPLSFYFVPTRSIFERKHERPACLEGFLLQMSQLACGQYCRVGILQIYLHDTDQIALLSYLKRQENRDVTYYQEDRSRSCYVIEII